MGVNSFHYEKTLVLMALIFSGYAYMGSNFIIFILLQIVIVFTPQGRNLLPHGGSLSFKSTFHFGRIS